MTTTGTNNLIRFAIFLGLSLCIFFLGAFNVNANTFADVIVGYGYTPVVNNTVGSRSWVSYNSSNLVNYGYNLSANNYYQIDEFNIRFRPTGGFQKSTSYTVSFTWDNYHPTIDDYNFYADWLLMTHSLYCYSSSWSSSGQTGSSCFTSSNISAQQNGNNSILVTFTFVPSSNFYGLALVNQHGSTFTFYKSVGWEIHDIAYSYSTNGSQDIINNANQNTQNIINNQNQNTEDMINNQNDNTQDIINNQNSNTQDIIDNQNSNTQAIIDSNKSCRSYNNSDIVQHGKRFLDTGELISTNGYGVTDYIPLNKDSDFFISLNVTANAPFTRYCFFDNSRTFISCSTVANATLNSNLNIPVATKYVRFTIIESENRPIYNICSNSGQAITDAITDDNVGGSTSSADSFFSNFTTETYGLTSVITAPLSFIQSLTSKTCSDLVLPLPYVNRNLTLPCMTPIYQQNFGTFLTMYQTITFGIVSYWVIVRIFNLVKDFKNPDHDEIEVMDL